MPTSLSDNLQHIREVNQLKAKMIVHNWREQIPSDSQWFPNSTGRPDCPHCYGLGWLRDDLPFGSPGFGKLSKCICAK